MKNLYVICVKKGLVRFFALRKISLFLEWRKFIDTYLLTCLVLIFVVSAPVCATPPDKPVQFDMVRGKVLYAVWQGKQTVDTFRLVDVDIPRPLPHTFSIEPRWHLVIGDIEGIDVDMRQTINVGLSLDMFFPKMPKMDAFPKEAMLVAIKGDKALPVTIGGKVILRDLQFQLFEDAVGHMTVKKVEFAK